MLKLPGAAGLQALDPSAKAALAVVLREIQKDARERADKCWSTHKGPMALYWKAIGVYSGHLARVLNRKAEAGK